MKKAVIWDLDGTILDSYDMIVESIDQTLKENGIAMLHDEIRRCAIISSIKLLFEKVSAEYGVDAQMLSQVYSKISSGKYREIKSMQNASACLEALVSSSVDNYVFTHRGRTTLPVLENLKMSGYFVEIVTSQNGFSRKPDPEGLLYLLNKYNLSKEHTYYVGDRSIDMDCAANAGIPGVLFLPQGSIDVSGGSEKFIIRNLLEVLEIV